MKYAVRLRLASLVLELRISNRRFFNRVCKRYGDCITHDTPQYKIDCARETLPAGNPNVLARVEFENAWHAKRFDFSAEWNNGTGRVGFSGLQTASFDSFLRVFCATSLPQQNGLLFHSAGIETNGKAFLFVGPSGFGKSTICALSRPRRILSDEIVAVTFSRNRAFAFATPFWGSLGTGPCPQTRFPLREIVFLRKDRTHRKAPIGISSTFTKLLRCLCRFDHCSRQTEKIMDLAGKLVTAVPCSELHFRRDADFWDLLKTN